MKTVKTVEEMKRAVETMKLSRWNIHDCSFCGYQCGYVFYDGRVFYDSGCDCVNHPSNWEDKPRSWEDVALAYNRNHPENNAGIAESYTKEVDALFGFQ